MRRVSLIPWSLIVAACVSAPAPHQFDQTAVIAMPKDEVWSNIMEYFTSSQIQIRTVERDSGIVYAESARTTAGTVLDCGTYNDQPISGVATMNVFVNDVGPGQTSVTVNVAGNGGFRDAWNGQFVAVECYSTGALERTILQAAAAP